MVGRDQTCPRVGDFDKDHTFHLTLECVFSLSFMIGVGFSEFLSITYLLYVHRGVGVNGSGEFDVLLLQGYLWYQC